MKTSNHRLHAVLTGALALFTVAGAQAQQSTSLSEANRIFRQEIRSCEGLRGEARSLCVREAHGALNEVKRGRAMQPSSTTSSSSSSMTMGESRYDTLYRVRTQRCDTLSGNERDVCKTESKEEYDRAMAQMGGSGGGDRRGTFSSGSGSSSGGGTTGGMSGSSSTQQNRQGSGTTGSGSR